MSFYSRIEGEITYSDKKSFTEIYRILRKGFWIDAEGYFLDEGGHKITELPTISFDEMKIVIPNYYYRNLTNVPFFKGSESGHLIGTSTDGCFVGWIKTKEAESHYDLLTWAVEYLGMDEEYIPDPNKNFPGYCAWQSSVEQEFFKYAEECAEYDLTFLQ